MPDDDERPKSGLKAFWSSLPGVLTGVAAVIAAVGTLATVFVSNRGDDPEQPATQRAIAGGTGTAGSTGEGDCPASYLKGIPEERLDTVEAGTQDFDAITSDQPKAGTLGLTLTDSGATIGAIRLSYFPANSLFKIESIVDQRCAPIDDYENISRGGDPNVMQNWDTARMQLDGQHYDLRIGASTTIRLNFVSYVP